MAINNDKAKALLCDKRFIFGAALFLLVTITFAVSLNMRSEYNNYASEGHHHHLTATSVIFTNNWLDDGIFSDHFAMMANPDSAEFETLKDRSFYDSYPPGCILPLYFLANVSGRDRITFGFVQKWDLFNQYMNTLLLAFLVYLLFLKIKIHPAIGLLAAVTPTFVNIFMPSPFYFYHSVYFSDQAVLLPFILTIFLEFLRMCAEEEKPRKIISVIQGVVMFFGALTDYLFLCLVLVIYVKRLILKEVSFKSVWAWFKDSLKFAAPTLIALGLFALQILVDGPVRIVEMFLFRTGASDTSGWTQNFEHYFWDMNMANAYGESARLIVKSSLVFVAAAVLVYAALRFIKKFKNKNLIMLLSVSAIIIFPCFIQVYLLKNHSAIHDFSTMKFAFVIGTIPYVFAPATVVEFVRSLIKFFKKPADAESEAVQAEQSSSAAGMVRKYSAQLIMGAVILCFGIAGCHSVYGAYSEKASSFFPQPTPIYEKVGTFIDENTDHDDVVFSNNFDIADSNYCPQEMAFSMKRVYKVEDYNAIYDKVKDIDGNYIINIFSAEGPVTAPGLKRITDAAYDTETRDNMYLYKISKDDFLKLKR